MSGTTEDLLAALNPLPMDVTDTHIKDRRKQLEHISSCISRLTARLRAELDYLYSICPHTDKYDSNWCGRDPGGGGCNVCGKSW